jgi:hypothetical protein
MISDGRTTVEKVRGGKKANVARGTRARTEGDRMSAASLNVVGLLLNLLGVVLLFRYGMPFRVRTDGSQVRWLTGVKNQKIVKAERVHSVLGWIGLTLIVLGTASQVWATLKGT